MVLFDKIKQIIGLTSVHCLQKLGYGKISMLGKELWVPPDVFNPKFFSTSRFLAEHMNININDSVLDMGTGSGILAIVAGNLANNVHAVDINPSAVLTARKNVFINGLETKIKVLESDLFDVFKKEQEKYKFEKIIFNFPYFEGVIRKKIDFALYDPGKELAEKFFKDAHNYLKENGSIYTAYSSAADIKKFHSIAENYAWRCETVAKSKFFLENIFINRFWK